MHLTVFNCEQTRRSDRQHWASHSTRGIVDAVREALSQNVNTETTQVDGLLTALQQTRECLITPQACNSYSCRT